MTLHNKSYLQNDSNNMAVSTITNIDHCTSKTSGLYQHSLQNQFLPASKWCWVKRLVIKINVKRERCYLRVVKADFKLRGKSGVFNIVGRQNRLFRYFAASLSECSICKSGSSNTSYTHLHISEDEKSSSQMTRFFVRISLSQILYFTVSSVLFSTIRINHFMDNSIYIAKAEMSSRNISWGVRAAGE